MTRFDAFEVSPVLATDIDGMGGTEIQAFGTLAEAVTALAATEAAGLAAQLSWTVYGHTPGEGAEAIADFETEADAFALLYKLTGIAGQTGVTLYRLPHPQTITVWTCTSQADFEPTTTVHVTEHDAQAELLGRMRSDLTTEQQERGAALLLSGKEHEDYTAFADFVEDTSIGIFDHYAVEPHGLVF